MANNILAPNFLTRQPIEKAIQNFATQFKSDQTVIDIGCGTKPYAKYFAATYVGVDPFPGTLSDVKAHAWDIPLPDASADAIILTQSLEHIQKTEPTVKEVYRLLKPGGQVFISVPLTMRLHSLPMPLHTAPVENIPESIASVWKEDYYRFSKYGLLYIFRAFKPLVLRETRTTFSTILQQLNYFVASLGIGWFGAPFYLVMNCLALVADAFFAAFARLPFAIVKRFDELVVRSLTTDYVFICQKPVVAK